jgi:hypothetical protein
MTKTDYIKQKQKIEEQEFTNLASKLNIKKYEFTPLTERYDVKFRKDGQLYIAETKVRADKTCEYFNVHGPFLELSKIQGMYRVKEDLASKEIYVNMQYINCTKDGYQIYNLSEPWTYDFSWRWLPKDNYNKDVFIWKMVHELQNPTITIKK